MPVKKLTVKRRQWKRFKVKGAATVLLHKPRIIEFGKPSFIELGPIIDISMGGLAVQYIENKNRTTECENLSINLPSSGVKVEKLPYKVVSDVKIAQLPDSRRIRNRCVQFEDLTSYSKFQLESFIRNYTEALLKDRRSGGDRRKFNDPKFDDRSYSAMYEKRVMGDRRSK